MKCLSVIVLIVCVLFIAENNCDPRPPNDSAAYGKSSAEVANILLNNLSNALGSINATFSIVLRHTQMKLNEGSLKLQTAINQAFTQLETLKRDDQSTISVQCVQDITLVGYSVYDDSVQALKECENEAVFGFENVIFEAYSKINQFKYEADESIRGSFDVCNILYSFNESPKISENCYSDRLRFIRLRAAIIEFEVQSILTKSIQTGLQAIQNVRRCVNKEVVLEMEDVLNGVVEAATLCQSLF